VVGFNESTNTFKKITAGSDGKFTFSNVRTVAIDTRNQLWIGTTKGLRVLPNIGNFQTEDQMKANPIILEDNLAQELLFEQLLLILLLMELIISGLALPILVCFSLTKRSGNQISFYDK
jgi:hypothetical protein